MSEVVRVDELTIGMYVHLDMSWMSHPFSRSSFRIERDDQIAQLRSLGVSTLRWDPERSTLAAGRQHSAPAVAVVEARPLSDEDAQAETRRAALAHQRQLAAECEAQYAEAGKAWRDAFDRVQTDPHGARRETEALSQALMTKMLAEDDLCIRTVNLAAGDSSAAHAMNVSVISMLLARTLGLPPEEVADIGTGALMHDVGKLDLPRRLWHVDDQFNTAERAVYASHVEQGLRHARRMGLRPMPTDVIGQHHERADGAGFPRGLRGEAVALSARIVSLINRFDNLCNPPHLSNAVTPHEALSRLFAHQRSHYDSTVLNVFIRMMGVYPAGSVVQLTDERFGVVISVNATRPLKPRVLTFDPGVPSDEALHLDLASVPNLGIRRSLRATQLPQAARDYLAPRERMAYFFEPGKTPELEAQAA